MQISTQLVCNLHNGRIQNKHRYWHKFSYLSARPSRFCPACQCLDDKYGSESEPLEETLDSLRVKIVQVETFHLHQDKVKRWL